MSIYYALISRGSVVLVDHTETSGNFEQATASILPNISTHENTRCTYASQGYHFHVVIEDGLIYLCIADASLGKRAPYAYLHEIKRRFTSSALKARAMVCNAYELRRDFSQVLASQLSIYNKGEFEDPAFSHIHKAQKEVEDVKGIMTQNIQKILERGEKLDLLVEKAEDLEASAHSFKKGARNLRKKFWWQNQRNCLIIIAVVLVLLGVIALIILAALHIL